LWSGNPGFNLGKTRDYVLIKKKRAGNQKKKKDMVERREIVFNSLCSQLVHNDVLEVLNGFSMMFPKFLMCSPRVSPHFYTPTCKCIT
jgi:hypothetical protein